MLLEIDFLQYQQLLLRKKQDGQLFLFDPIRKKYLVQTPEEMVRQLVLLYLQRERSFMKNRLAVEKMLRVNELVKRCDILVYQQDMSPMMLVECKAPAVPISQETFRQIAIYNLPLKVPYLLVTNGRQSYCCEMDYTNGSYTFLQEVPGYPRDASG